MNQVVQVRCPKCQTVLRVPAEWLAQAMRCKHCQQVFQGVAGPAATPAKPAAANSARSGTPARNKAPQSARQVRPQQAAPRPKMKPLPAALLVSALCVSITCAGHFSWVMLRGPVSDRPFPQASKGGNADPGTLAQNTSKESPSGEKTPNTIPPKKNPDDPPKKTKEPPKKEEPKTREEPKVDPAKKDPPRKDPPKTDPPRKDLPKTEEPKTVPPAKVKDDPPKKEPRPEPVLPPPLKSDPKVPAKPRSPDDPFPRRALLVSVNDYLFCNPVSYGTPVSSGKAPPYPGSSTQALVSLLTRPPFRIPDEQIAELSDGIPADSKQRRPRDPLKQVIKDTLEDFLNSSRPQDRILVLFAGHTVDVEAECFLVPLEGNKDDVNTLIPLSWVLDRLAKCKAKQKLLVLDVCRYPLVRGMERTGAAEEMSEQLDTLLMNPPAGVQVWSSCTKGQKSSELARGGAFLEAVCTVLKKDFEKDASLQTEPLPLGLIVPEVNQRMKELLEPFKMEQVSRVSGFETNNDSTYDPDEKQAGRPTIALPKFTGADIAGAGQVNDIVDELKMQPAARPGQSLPRTYPPFSAKVLAEYKADYPTWELLQEMIAREPEKYALRKAVLDAIAAMNESQKLQVMSRLPNPKGGPLPDNIKNSFVPQQREAALKIQVLNDALEKLQAAAASRDKETSKRWQAHYDFTVARMQERLLYIYEYNFMIGSIRLDLPELDKEKGHNGWRLVPRDAPQVLAKEKKEVKDMYKFMNRGWKHLAAEHAGTPWAVFAVRELQSNLGLEWRASKD